MPCVEYSGKTIISIPGKPCFIPLTSSHIFPTFSITSSQLWRRGIGYWYTHTPTVSGEEEISPVLARFIVLFSSVREGWYRDRREVVINNQFRVRPLEHAFHSSKTTHPKRDVEIKRDRRTHAHTPPPIGQMETTKRDSLKKSEFRERILRSSLNCL